MLSRAQQFGCSLLAVLLACAVSGCSSSGFYSVRYDDQAIVPQGAQFDESYGQAMPGEECVPEQVSLTDALATFCGPPELFHDELMHGDPGAIVAPTPKYHPLPTRPVFEPPYYPPPATMSSEPLPPARAAVDDHGVAQRSTNWRGPRKRFALPLITANENTRLAKSPLQGVTFPPLDPQQVPPERITPGGAEPLLR